MVELSTLVCGKYLASGPRSTGHGVYVCVWAIGCVMCPVSCVMCAAYLPGEAGVWLPVHVAGLGELLGVGVPWQLLEEEVVEAVLVDEALDGDDVGLDTLDNAEGRGCDREAIL